MDISKQKNDIGSFTGIFSAADRVITIMNHTALEQPVEGA